VDLLTTINGFSKGKHKGGRFGFEIENKEKN
jgi:hypothetical protein